MARGAIFRRVNELARRFPAVFAGVGLALVAEGGRIVWSMGQGGPVAVLGAGGITHLDPIGDRTSLAAWAGWTAIAGIVMLSFARRGARAAKRAARAAALRRLLDETPQR